MTPKNLMILGAFGGLVLSFVTIFADIHIPIIIMAFGALFGKGYGIWEERNK